MDGDQICRELSKFASDRAEFDQLLEETVRILHESNRKFHWTRIYELFPDNILRLWPSIGAATDHIFISVGRAVCGSAVAEKRNKIICGVTKEPNYLACSSRSRSELVVLIQKDGKIFAQIDIDSRDLDTFDERAVETVEKVADWLANAYEARAGQVEERIAKYGQARPQAADLKHKVDELERLIRIQKTRSVSLNASARNSLLTRLLQPFHQADASTTRKYSGTGLGPAISHRFCQMMRGKISVESRLHEGSAFTFRVPATHQGG